MKGSAMTPKLSRKSVALAALAAVLPAILSAGCATGPEYRKPEVTPPAQFRSQVQPSEAISVADSPWWGMFNDEALRSLIAQALATNLDIQVAIARIEQARALVGVVQSETRPQLGYQASAGGENALVPSKSSADTVGYAYAGGLLNAAWELDVWGRIRHATDAAKAHLVAQEDVRNGVLLTLVSDVGAGYFRLLELDRELAIAEDSVRVYKQTLDLFNARFEGGRDSQLPVERARANYDFSIARIADLKRAITQQENALSVLAGGYPRAIERGRGLTEQSMPPTPVGLTTDLLQRRPDILEAEQNMIQANAEIGIAVANYYPRIGLSALLGVQGLDIGSWRGFGLWNLAISAAGPIYTGGRLQAVTRERQAQWDESVAQYKKTILVAFRETSDALIAQQTLVDRRAALERQVQDLQRSSDLALMRYDAGRASYFEVLETQQQLFPAQDALAQTQRDQLVAVVSLYKALGGGWKTPPGAPAAQP
jgi:multidrug efflux system outer membrane protein